MCETYGELFTNYKHGGRFKVVETRVKYPPGTFVRVSQSSFHYLKHGTIGLVLSSYRDGVLNIAAINRSDSCVIEQFVYEGDIISSLDIKEVFNKKIGE